jgi:hypothetical protein
VATNPTVTQTPGPPGSTGETLTVNIPFTVCFGACNTGSTTLGSTGLFVGQLTQVATPGLGVGYQLSLLQVYVNGILVENLQNAAVWAYVNPFGAVAQSLSLPQGGPCVVGVCTPGAGVPTGYVMTTNNPVVGFAIPGVGTFNVPIGHVCLYNNGMSCPPG